MDRTSSDARASETSPPCFNSSTSPGKHFQQTRQIAAPLGRLLYKLTSLQLDENRKDGWIGITNCKDVASYNLMTDLNDKKILVPGQPPVWKPLPGANRLKEDAGIYYRDDNAVRFPEYPLEPAVKAILSMDKTYGTSKVDIFACGSTLGHVLSFVMGKKQPFTFVVEKIGNAMFLIRRNRSPAELIDDVRGFGHSFPEAYTEVSEEFKDSASHQRIVEYEFGGLRCLVRFEADGYVGEEVKAAEGEEDAVKADDHKKETQEQTLVVEKKGSHVPHSALFDLKTRSATKHNHDTIIETQLPRLWVRQIRNFILAFHNARTFEAPEFVDISEDLVGWEEYMQEPLGRMAALLAEIRDAVSMVEGGKFEVRHEGGGEVQFRELSDEEGKEWHALPETVEQEWKGYLRLVQPCCVSEKSGITGNCCSYIARDTMRWSTLIDSAGRECRLSLHNTHGSGHSQPAECVD